MGADRLVSLVALHCQANHGTLFLAGTLAGTVPRRVA